MRRLPTTATGQSTCGVAGAAVNGVWARNGAVCWPKPDGTPRTAAGSRRAIPAVRKGKPLRHGRVRKDLLNLGALTLTRIPVKITTTSKRVLRRPRATGGISRIIGDRDNGSEQTLPLRRLRSRMGSGMRAGVAVKIPAKSYLAARRPAGSSLFGGKAAPSWSNPPRGETSSTALPAGVQ